jgi:hypothetical protein
MKLKFVPNAASAPRWISMRILAFVAVLQVTWEALPPDALALIPADWRGYITLALVLAAMLGRLVDQGTATPPPPEDPRL